MTKSRLGTRLLARLTGAERSRTGKTLLTFVGGLLQQVASAAVNFLITPIIVNGLGSELYGAWQIINQTINLLAVSDLRPLSALKFSLATKQHVDDDDAKLRQIGAAIAIWVRMLPLVAAGGLLLVAFAPFYIKTSSEFVGIVRLALGLAVLNLVLSTLTSIPATVLRSMNLTYKGAGYVAMTSVVMGICQAIAVWLGFGLPGVVLATLIGNVLGGVAQYVVTTRWVPWFRLRGKSPQKVEVSSLMRFSVWVVISALAVQFLLSADYILIGIVLSPVGVTVYSLTKIVVDKFSSIYLGLLSSSLPSFGDLVGRDDRATILQVRRQMSLFSLFAMMVIGSGVILLNQDFMALWLGTAQYAGDTVNLLLVLAATFGMLNRVDSMVIDSTMKISHKTIALLVAGGINILLGLLLMPSLGLVGMAVGTLVGRGIVLVANPAILSRFLNVSVDAYFKQLARPMVTLVVLFAMARIGSPHLNPDTWLELLVAAAGVAVVAAGVGWLVGLSRSDRYMIVARFGLPERVKRLLFV